ncbi:hypothetical protein [Arthrobacter sp. StoSoilB22]|uniref:beta-sandwich lipoprotein n=1 Tax=Arthrobacter sp. StoSoilB22 TaxID=2830996 RepID=UPI001CC66A69|nr:hypothetical protein [Arthrobacter sp. StoSoilB22]BCW61889.1 hypothetical protein StoSoilB22_08620 [Arthrobacter sp. StoSoilB22]
MKLATKVIAATVALFGSLALTSCTSDAKTASDNLSKAADQFEVQRKIVGVNTRTSEYLFYVEGRCSIERAGDLIVTCRQGPNDYRKHFIGQATDVAWVSTQMDAIDVSVYHTRVIVKPEGLIPEIDLQGGKQ